MGNVILDQGPRRLTGDYADLQPRAPRPARIRHATGQVTPDYYFTGAEVDKTGPDTYVVEHGVFTSCSQPVPDWSFRLGRREIEVDGYAHVAQRHDAGQEAAGPLHAVHPLAGEDRAQLRLPGPQHRLLHRRGAELGLAYFQTLGRSYDTTFHLDTYSKGYLGLGDEFRYAPTEGTKGNFIGYYVRDPETERPGAGRSS